LEFESAGLKGFWSMDGVGLVAEDFHAIDLMTMRNHMGVSILITMLRRQSGSELGNAHTAACDLVGQTLKGLIGDIKASAILSE